MREQLQSLRIAVLMGGLSREREVSLRSGSRVLESLLRQGFQADRDRRRSPHRRAAAGDQASTSPSSRCTAATARTARSRVCSRCSASPTPARASSPRRWHEQGRDQAHAARASACRPPPSTLARRRPRCRRGGPPDRRALGLPAVVKPVAEGSSIGVHIADTRRRPRPGGAQATSTTSARSSSSASCPGARCRSASSAPTASAGRCRCSSSGRRTASTTTQAKYTQRHDRLRRSRRELTPAVTARDPAGGGHRPPRARLPRLLARSTPS